MTAPRKTLPGRQCVSLYVMEPTIARADALVDSLPVRPTGLSRADVWREAIDIGLDELERRAWAARKKGKAG